jgi:hypothetical protein
MAQRCHHYERAFEEFLRARRVPYVAVDEARKTLLPSSRADAPGPDDGPPALKSFDFVVYGRSSNLLVDIKGRRLGSAPSVGARSRAARLECWVTAEDVRAMTHWQRLFGDGFLAAFVFIYWCEAQPPDALFQEMFEDRGRWYAVRAVPAASYASRMRVRSPRWGTVDLSGEDFERLSEPLCPEAFPPPLPGAARPRIVWS